jgi:hypothetical protein
MHVLLLFSFSLFYVFGLIVDWCGMDGSLRNFLNFLNGFSCFGGFWWMVSLGSEKMVF